MSSLDDKLREKITKQIADGVREYRPEGKPIEEITDAILKVIVKAGWQPKPDFGDMLKASKKLKNYPEGLLMTGQDWYQAYETEKGQGSLDNLKDMPHSKYYSDGIDHAVIKCDEAAKRASGLDKPL